MRPPAALPVLAVLLAVVALAGPSLAGPTLAQAAQANGTRPVAMPGDALALRIAGEVRGAAVYDLDAALVNDPATAYRMVGTPTHDAARGWIEQRFRDAGLEPKEFPHACSGPNALVVGPDVVQRFPAGLSLPQPAVSVLALVPGRSLTDWVVVGGHYDTQESTVGALDNAAGVAEVLALAKVFAQHRGELDASVLFAAWDCEEWGVWGGKSFMDRLPDVERLFGLPNGSLHLRMAAGLDMPGLNWPAQDVWPTYHKGAYSVLHVRTSPVGTFGFKSSYGEYNVSNYTQAQLAGFRHYRAVVEHAAYDLLGYPRPWVWVEDDTHGRTDHVPFVAAGVPGMRVHGPSDEEYPAYHDAGDTLPVLEASAGGKDKLVAGMESSARLTALTAALMALDAPDAPDAPVTPAEARAVPGPEGGVVLVALAAFALVPKRAGTKL